MKQILEKSALCTCEHMCIGAILWSNVTPSFSTKKVHISHNNSRRFLSAVDPFNEGPLTVLQDFRLHTINFYLWKVEWFIPLKLSIVIKSYFVEFHCIVLTNKNNITVLTRLLPYYLVKFNLIPILLYQLKVSLILITSIEP